jgi:DNA-binding CsgD family transcriptional regulator
LTWIAQGKTYKDISLITGMAFGTIKTYLDTARHKLHAVNVAQAVAKAITLGMITIRKDNGFVNEGEGI